MEHSILDALTFAAAANGGVLWRSHLTAAGLSHRDIGRFVSTGHLERIHRDAYRLPVEDEHPATRFAAEVSAVRARDPERVVTGPAAVSLLGLPVFGRPSTVHVAVDRRGGSSARSTWTTVARPPVEQLVSVRGGLVADAARAVLDTARLQSLVAGVVAADAALARKVTTPEELREVLASMAHLRGVARARLCCDLADGRSESPGESWSAVVMHGHGIPRPERQHLVVDGTGTVGRADFWWPEHRSIGEFDGRIKYGRQNPSRRPPEEVLWDEKVREDRLRSVGLAVVRWTTPDLRRPTHWIQRLRSALA
jgi:hypothetical protein